MPATIGERLRACMARAGDTTVRDVQRRTGVAYATLHNILDPAKTVTPGPETLKKLAAAYQVTVEWLLTGRERETDPADELIAALEHPVAGVLRADVPVADVIAAAYAYAAEKGFTAEQFAKLDRWRNQKLKTVRAK